MWGWHEVSSYLRGPNERSRGAGQEPNLWADVLGNSAQQFWVLNQTKFTAQMTNFKTIPSLSSKNPPILSPRPKCTQLTLLLHQMMMFGTNGLTFHWTCHPLPPPHRQSTPHWFLMAVFWRGAQLKRKKKCLLTSRRQKSSGRLLLSGQKRSSTLMTVVFYYTQDTWKWAGKMRKTFYNVFTESLRKTWYSNCLNYSTLLL